MTGGVVVRTARRWGAGGSVTDGVVGAAAGLAHFLCARGQERLHGAGHQGVLITTINGQPVAAHPMARFLMDAGFHPGPLGMHLRRILLPLGQQPHEPGRTQSGEVQ